MADYTLLEGPQGSTVLRQDGERQVIVAGPGLDPEEARRFVDKANRGSGLAIGEAFEWLAAAAFVAAAYLWHRWIPLALLAFAVCLYYFGQCYATSHLHLPKIRRSKRRPRAARQRSPRRALKERSHAAFERLRH